MSNKVTSGSFINIKVKEIFSEEIIQIFSNDRYFTYLTNNRANIGYKGLSFKGLVLKKDILLRKKYLEENFKDILGKETLEILELFFNMMNNKKDLLTAGEENDWKSFEFYSNRTFQNLSNEDFKKTKLVAFNHIKSKFAKKIMELHLKNAIEDFLKFFKKHSHSFDNLSEECLVRLANLCYNAFSEKFIKFINKPTEELEKTKGFSSESPQFLNSNEYIVEVFKDKEKMYPERELKALIEVCKLILKTDDKTKHQELIMGIFGLKINKFSHLSKSQLKIFFEVFKALNEENLLSKDFFKMISNNDCKDNSDKLIRFITLEFFRGNLVVEAYEFLKKGCQSSMEIISRDNYSEKGRNTIQFLIMSAISKPYVFCESFKFSLKDSAYFPFKMLFYIGALLPLKWEEKTKAFVGNLKNEKEIWIVLENLKKENLNQVKKNFRDGMEFTKKFIEVNTKFKIKKNKEEVSQHRLEKSKTEKQTMAYRLKKFNCEHLLKEFDGDNDEGENLLMLEYYKNQIERLKEENLEISIAAKEEIEKISRKISFKKHFLYPFIFQLRGQIDKICENSGNKNELLESLEGVRNKAKKEIEVKKFENFNFLLAQNTDTFFNNFVVSNEFFQ